MSRARKRLRKAVDSVAARIVGYLHDWSGTEDVELAPSSAFAPPPPRRAPPGEVIVARAMPPDPQPPRPRCSCCGQPVPHPLQRLLDDPRFRLDPELRARMDAVDGSDFGSVFTEAAERDQEDVHPWDWFFPLPLRAARGSDLEGHRITIVP